jgi:hypothetical protein
MKHYTAPFALLLALFLAGPAQAQRTGGDSLDSLRAEVENVVTGSGVVAALDSIAAASTPELQRTLDQLASTLNVFAARIAGDAELRSSALRAAQGLLGVAQVAVVQHADTLEEALRAASERIATLPEAGGQTPR